MSPVSPHHIEASIEDHFKHDVPVNGTAEQRDPAFALPGHDVQCATEAGRAFSLGLALPIRHARHSAQSPFNGFKIQYRKCAVPTCVHGVACGI